jgi:hypothetical protein
MKEPRTPRLSATTGVQGNRAREQSFEHLTIIPESKKWGPPVGPDWQALLLVLLLPDTGQAALSTMQIDRRALHFGLRVLRLDRN